MGKNSNTMTRAEVDALVAKKYPQALLSPIAMLIRNITGGQNNLAALHARNCLEQCDGWDIETLSHNIESNFPDLDIDDCDEIAEAAIAQATGE